MKEHLPDFTREFATLGDEGMPVWIHTQRLNLAEQFLTPLLRRDLCTLLDPKIGVFDLRLGVNGVFNRKAHSLRSRSCTRFASTVLPASMSSRPRRMDFSVSSSSIASIICS